MELLAEAPWRRPLLESEGTETEAFWRARAEKGAIGHEKATYVAEYAEELVGLADVYLCADGKADLAGMWTAAAMRRRGVGLALAKAACDWAEQEGATTVELWVETTNDAAKNLYAELDFVPVGCPVPLAADPARTQIKMVRFSNRF